MQIQEKINKIREEIRKGEAEIKKLEVITSKFPDAYIQQDRWKTERVFSETATPLCDKYEWKHSCGCCSDSPLFAYPYLETEFGKVYAHGAPFRILDRDEWGSGNYLRNKFDVRATALSDSMKSQIQDHIDRWATKDKEYPTEEDGI